MKLTGNELIEFKLEGDVTEFRHNGAIHRAAGDYTIRIDGKKVSWKYFNKLAKEYNEPRRKIMYRSKKTKKEVLMIQVGESHLKDIKPLLEYLPWKGKAHLTVDDKGVKYNSASGGAYLRVGDYLGVFYGDVRMIKKKDFHKLFEVAE